MIWILLLVCTCLAHGGRPYAERRNHVTQNSLEENADSVRPLASFLLSLSSGQPRGLAVHHQTRAGHPRAISLLDLLGGGGDPELIDPKNAIKGRPQRPFVIPDRHYVLGQKMETVPDGYKVAVFGNGCFWGSEKGIWRLPGDGIHTTAVGYCAGFTENPTYEEVCSGATGHTEGVKVVYDPSKISFVDILRWFWEAHDPTQGMGQGNDRGTQYRSGFYYFDDEQKALIEASKAAYEKALGRTITTEVTSASDYEQYGGLWFYAEPYHQQYLAKPSARPYCSAQPQCVSLPSFEEWAPAGLEHHAPKLPESFWRQHAPGKGCKVVLAPNEPIEFDLTSS